MHEAIFSHKKQSKNGVVTLDIAKRLIDYGFHPMTVYFPLVVEGAMLIEPTESVGRADLDAFVDAMIDIDTEAREDPDLVKNAPHSLRVSAGLMRLLPRENRCSAGAMISILQPPRPKRFLLDAFGILSIMPAALLILPAEQLYNSLDSDDSRHSCDTGHSKCFRLNKYSY